MWVINIQHWLDETMSGPAVPQLRLKVKKISEIITCATSVAAGLPAESIPQCWRRPRRRPCKGELDIELNKESGHIQMSGHPVFIAQHATATCCRGCILKWHGIEKGRSLNDKEIDYDEFFLNCQTKSKKLVDYRCISRNL